MPGSAAKAEPQAAHTQRGVNANATVNAAINARATV